MITYKKMLEAVRKSEEHWLENCAILEGGGCLRCDNIGSDACELCKITGFREKCSSIVCRESCVLSFLDMGCSASCLHPNPWFEVGQSVMDISSGLKLSDTVPVMHSVLMLVRLWMESITAKEYYEFVEWARGEKIRQEKD